MLVGELRKEKEKNTECNLQSNSFANYTLTQIGKSQKEGGLQHNWKTICICVEVCAYPQRNEILTGFV